MRQGFNTLLDTDQPAARPLPRTIDLVFAATVEAAREEVRTSPPEAVSSYAAVRTFDDHYPRALRYIMKHQFIPSIALLLTYQVPPDDPLENERRRLQTLPAKYRMSLAVASLKLASNNRLHHADTGSWLIVTKAQDPQTLWLTRETLIDSVNTQIVRARQTDHFRRKEAPPIL